MNSTIIHTSMTALSNNTFITDTCDNLCSGAEGSASNQFFVLVLTLCFFCFLFVGFENVVILMVLKILAAKYLIVVLVTCHFFFVPFFSFESFFSCLRRWNTFEVVVCNFSAAVNKKIRHVLDKSQKRQTSRDKLATFYLLLETIFFFCFQILKVRIIGLIGVEANCVIFIVPKING